MTELDPIGSGLEPNLPDDVIALAERLRSERPLPSPGFRGDLGRQLEARAPRVRRPEHARVLIARFSLAGTLLLTLGTLGAAGLGPLGG